MSDSNQQTIDAYQAYPQEYIAATSQDIEGLLKEWLDAIVARTPKNARILELGSASGRDAAYLQTHGFSVECSDGTQAFVNILQQKGFTARHLNALTDDISGPYDLIFANAVMPHFTRAEAKKVLQKAYKALAGGGVFTFNVKKGHGETWIHVKVGLPRYCCFWTEEQIRPLLRTAGFTNIQISDEKITKNNTWLQISAKKPSS